ncbi:Glycerol-3-phosphate acyltransferase, partial [Operophtera brumata]
MTDKQKYANGGVVSRYLCDLVQCFNLTRFDYKDVVPKVENDDSYLRAVEESTQEQLWRANKDKSEHENKTQYASVRRRVEAKAKKILSDISSAMSNNVLKFVAWCCHKGIRRIAIGGCGTRSACVERLRRANAAGLPLIFVPLHRSHFDYILVTFALYLTGVRPPLVAAGDNMRIPFFGDDHFDYILVTFVLYLTGVRPPLVAAGDYMRMPFFGSSSKADAPGQGNRSLLKHFKAPIESPLSPPNNNLAINLDKQILYNHSHSSLYGADVSSDYKMMVEAIGRHLVYDAAQATALMCTNIVSYVLLTEHRRGCTAKELAASVESRANSLKSHGRDLGYSATSQQALRHAVIGDAGARSRAEGGERRQADHPSPAQHRGVLGALLLLQHPTALETVIREPNADADVIYHSELMEAALQLSEVLSAEFILCAPCQRIEERLCDAVDSLVDTELITRIQPTDALEEERWSRRFAARLEEEADEEPRDPTRNIKYRINTSDSALAERRRLLLTLRPLLEAYAATNCLRLLRQWGVIEMYSAERERRLRILPPYDDEPSLREVCRHVTRFNVRTPLL